MGILMWVLFGFNDLILAKIKIGTKSYVFGFKSIGNRKLRCFKCVVVKCGCGEVWLSVWLEDKLVRMPLLSWSIISRWFLVGQGEWG